MKANQAFRANEEGVSPVIGVILMVAITVVLAAVVFVLVTRLAGGGNDDTPDITFQKTKDPDGRGSTFTVVSAAGDAGQWGAYDLLVNGTAINPMTLYSQATPTTCTIVVMGATVPIAAGHRIDCTANAVDGQQVQLRHRATNTLINVGTA
jgi:flagellin-like protein